MDGRRGHGTGGSGEPPRRGSRVRPLHGSLAVALALCAGCSADGTRLLEQRMSRPFERAAELLDPGTLVDGWAEDLSQAADRAGGLWTQEVRRIDGIQADAGRIAGLAGGDLDGLSRTGAEMLGRATGGVDAVADRIRRRPMVWSRTFDAGASMRRLSDSIRSAPYTLQLDRPVLQDATDPHRQTDPDRPRRRRPWDWKVLWRILP